MANEILVVDYLEMDSPPYQSPPPHSFTAAMTGTKGPAPGLVLAPATTGGVDLDFSRLDGNAPGICEITNLDPDNWLIYGSHDNSAPGNGRNPYWPLKWIAPGTRQVVRLSRYVEGSNHHAFVQGVGGPVYCTVEAFDQ